MTRRWLVYPAIFAIGVASGWGLHAIRAPEQPPALATESSSEPIAAANEDQPERGAEPEHDGAQSPRARLDALLVADRFRAGVRLYERVRERRRADVAAALRERLLAYADGSADPGQRDRAGTAEGVALLQAYTWLYARDAEALQLLADLYQRQGRQWEAIQALYQVIDTGGAASGVEAARRRAALLVDTRVSSLANQGDRAGVVELYRRVLELDPLNYRYRYLLGVWLGRLGRHDEALAALAQIPAGALPGKDTSRLARRLEEEAEMTARYGEGLPLERQGEHYTVRAELAGGQSLRLLLDTGATLMVLKPHVVGSAPLIEPVGRQVKLGTANGVTEAPLFRVSGLSLGPYQLDERKVVVLGLEGLEGLEGVDGLLGMDSLSEFDYQIDRAAEVLRLSRRNPSGEARE